MKNSKTRKEEILKKIRAGLKEKIELPYPEAEGFEDFYPKIKPEDFIQHFKENFEALGGHFIEVNTYQELPVVLKQIVKELNWQEVICANKDLFHFLVKEKLDFIREFNPDLARSNANASITNCEAAIARTGSFVFTSAQHKGRTTTIAYPNHLVILHKNQLFEDFKDALNFLENKYNHDFPSMLTVTSGPSRTADIEKTLVTGIHGPQAIYCLYIA